MVERRHRNLAADERFDVGQRDRVGFAAEADRVAGGAGARRAADSMHVVFGILRQVVVEHVAHAGHVQAARRDVRADEHGELAGLKVFEHAQALALRHVARKRLGFDAVVHERVAQPIRLAARVDEDHRAVRIAVAQQREEQRQLLLHRREIDRLRYAIDRHLVRLDANELGIVHVLVGELEHAMRERRREQHVQAPVMLRQSPQHEADVLDETEIEHAIGLVEDEHLNAAQAEHALLVEIDEASRRADQDVDACGEHVALFVVIRAAERQAQLERQVLAERRLRRRALAPRARESAP